MSLAALALDAEHALIGAGLCEPAACEEAFERVRPEHFGEGLHARLWAAMAARHRARAPADALAIARDLGADPDLAALGGASFLAELVDRASLWTVPAHADAVIDSAARRALGKLTREVAARAADTAQGPADALIAELERGAAEIARGTDARALSVPAGLDAVATLEAAWRGEFKGLPLGVRALDEATGGLKPQDLWFVAGRTSMGKSVVGLTIARAVAEQGRGVMVFSLEMPLREVQARLIADLAWDEAARWDAGEANIRYGDLLKGRGAPRQRARARAAAERLGDLPIHVADAGGLTIDEIKSQARRRMRAFERERIPRGAMVIDHIGLVRPQRARPDSKAAETADVVNELKPLAKELGCPVVALCQINRNTEARGDKRPTLADLNWSGAIEQAGDLIVLLYREAYYLERSSSTEDQDRAVASAHDLELLIHKNRSGPICGIKAFVDIACNVVRGFDDVRGAAGRAGARADVP